MVKIFVTGDNHFGKKYDRYKDVKEKLVNSRFECFQDMVHKAEKEGCELFVITGDLFDNINTVKVSDVKKVVEMLSAFSGAVLVLPGNHDYYTGNERVWKDFEKELSSCEYNIVLLNEMKTYSFDTKEEKIQIYPAYCQAKHSVENNLGWIKEQKIDSNEVINIGVAHGAIKGVTPDIKKEYFLMDEKELAEIPVDVWLIGHTHIPYPEILQEDVDTFGYKIFNAGTHEQTDLHNRTEGNGFIITIEKQGNTSRVAARKYISGKIRFYDLKIKVKPDSDTALEEALKETLVGIDKNSVLRVNVEGTIRQSEYEEKERIYKEVLGEYLTYEKSDQELSEEITADKIREEFAETSFAAKFMEELVDSPVELQMVYELLKNCRED